MLICIYSLYIKERFANAEAIAVTNDIDSTDCTYNRPNHAQPYFAADILSANCPTLKPTDCGHALPHIQSAIASCSILCDAVCCGRW